MATRDANLFGLKLGLLIFISSMLPTADTTIWLNLLMAGLQGIGIYVILEKLLRRFHTDEYNKNN